MHFYRYFNSANSLHLSFPISLSCAHQYLGLFCSLDPDKPIIMPNLLQLHLRMENSVQKCSKFSSTLTCRASPNLLYVLRSYQQVVFHNHTSTHASLSGYGLLITAKQSTCSTSQAVGSAFRSQFNPREMLKTRFSVITNDYISQ